MGCMGGCFTQSIFSISIDLLSMTLFSALGRMFPSKYCSRRTPVIWTIPWNWRDGRWAFSSGSIYSRATSSENAKPRRASSIWRRWLMLHVLAGWASCKANHLRTVIEMCKTGFPTNINNNIINNNVIINVINFVINNWNNNGFAFYFHAQNQPKRKFSLRSLVSFLPSLTCGLVDSTADNPREVLVAKSGSKNG